MIIFMVVYDDYEFEVIDLYYNKNDADHRVKQLQQNYPQYKNNYKVKARRVHV